MGADPVKFPKGMPYPIDYIHSLGLHWGHYTNAGVDACGGAVNSSEDWLQQDVSLFAEWQIDMIKVDNCDVVGNTTQIIFNWRDALNATGRPILFSNCRNGCMNDADHGRTNWEPYCVNLSNTWRISTDINAGWGSILHNMDCAKSFGVWAQPGAWNDLDLMEIDIGQFSYSNYHPSNATVRALRLQMNEAHFAIWSILSAPMIVGMDLRVIDDDIVKLITNKDAVAVNQNYLNHGGDVITEFNITDVYRKMYEEQSMKNDNQTELFYKPMPKEIGDAAVLMLNRNKTASYETSVPFNQLPLTDNHDDALQCTVHRIFGDEDDVVATQYNSTLYPMTGAFLLLSDCKSVS